MNGTIDSNHNGFTGSGFANTNNANGTGVDWAINGDSGSYTLTWRYANGASANRTAVVNVNGAAVSSNVNFTGTGSWPSWATTSATVNLGSGFKALRLQANQSNGLANIDNLEITGPNVSAASCSSADSGRSQ